MRIDIYLIISRQVFLNKSLLKRITWAGVRESQLNSPELSRNRWTKDTYHEKVSCGLCSRVSCNAQNAPRTWSGPSRFGKIIASHFKVFHFSLLRIICYHFLIYFHLEATQKCSNLQTYSGNTKCII